MTDANAANRSYQRWCTAASVQALKARGVRPGPPRGHRLSAASCDARACRHPRSHQGGRGAECLAGAGLSVFEPQQRSRPSGRAFKSDAQGEAHRHREQPPAHECDAKPCPVCPGHRIAVGTCRARVRLRRPQVNSDAGEDAQRDDEREPTTAPSGSCETDDHAEDQFSNRGAQLEHESKVPRLVRRGDPARLVRGAPATSWHPARRVERSGDTRRVALRSAHPLRGRGELGGASRPTTRPGCRGLANLL
jgi:hypothetical protein